MFNYYPDKPVNLQWQTLFVILDFFLLPTILYAFLRIQKFRRYLLLVLLPEMAIGLAIVVLFPIDLECESEWYWIIYDTCSTFEIQVIASAIYSGFVVFAIYLVRMWSLQWNEALDKQ